MGRRPPFTGVLQDFDRPEDIDIDDIDSPDPTFGGGAIMHGDNVVHDPVDGRADIPAMWVFGDFWRKYVSYCQGMQYIHCMGYPKTEQYEFDYGGFHFWWQWFENGYIFTSDADNEVYVRNLQGQPFGPTCDETDSDGDLVSDDDEVNVYGTDPYNRDTDGDGCAEGEEIPGGGWPKPGSTGPYDPLDYWDFYDVPVPANPDPTPNGGRSGAVNNGDVVAVLFYFGTCDDCVPNSNGVDYDGLKDGDWNGDTVVTEAGDQVGLRYDRSPSTPPDPPWDAGPPSGAVNMADVLAVLAQVGLSCSGPP
jgi:hypothetical protein